MKKLISTFLLAFVALSVYCHTLQNGVLTIDEGTETIYWGEFEKNNSITEVRFPNSLKTIGYCAFYQDQGLTSVSIPGTVDTLKGWAFGDCQNLKKVVIEDGVKSIKECAFYNTDVDTFVIPSSVTEILDLAFCTKKQNCIVVTAFGNTAYEYARKEGIRVKITEISDSYRSTIRAIELAGEQEVSDSLLYNCQKLEYVRLSNGLRRIGSAAFQNTALTHVDLPYSLSFIADDAFDSNVNFRVVAGSYAERWVLEHGYKANGRISDLIEYVRHPDTLANYSFPDGVVEYRSKDFTNLCPILSKDQVVDDIKNYSFKLNRPMNVRREGDSLVVTSFYLHPLKGALIGEDNDEFSPFAGIDVIQPLTEVRIPAPSSVGNGPFDVRADDSLYNVIRDIRLNTNVTFADVTHSEGEQYTWEPLSPIQAREWVYIFTNMCFILSTNEFEEKLYSYAGMCYNDALGKDLLYLDDLKKLYQRIIAREQTQLRRCGGDAWGLAMLPGIELGLTDWALMQHYQSCDNYSAAFHEFSHNMGFGHDGNMTSGQKPIGMEDDPDVEYYGFETAAYTIFQERLAQDRIIYNDIEILNSYDMYPTELTTERSIKTRIENYGEPKVMSPLLVLEDVLSLNDTATLTAKLLNEGAYFSNLVRAVVYSEVTGDSVASLGVQYVSLTEEQKKTKQFELADDSLPSGSYLVELQYFNSFNNEWMLPEPNDWAILSWTWNNPLLPESTTDVPEISTLLSLVVYPNPTTDVVHLQVPCSIADVRVYDMEGRRQPAEFEGNVVSFSNLPVGAYVIEVATDHGILHKTVVKK